jgi:tRNA-dihydrouridine synthase B
VGCEPATWAEEIARVLGRVNPPEQLDSLLKGPAPLLALAPMQEVTDAAFWKLAHDRGGPDIYWTEYFRVHAVSRPEKRILRAIRTNPTGRPIVAQLIGNHIPSLVRTVKELERFPVAAIDLNLGCPAPVVYKKCAGGGLLREPRRVDVLLGALRDAVRIKFTVKTRIGFDSEAVFDELLPVFAKHSLDLLTVHGRTVAQGYRLPVRYDLIHRAAEALPCPVIANGHVYSADQALEVLEQTQARGLMIGRGAIRNPWLFGQIRQRLRGDTVVCPTGRDVLAYIEALWEANCTPGVPESLQAQRMKLFTNFIGEGLAEDSERFLHAIRRADTHAAFFGICREHLDHDRPLKLEPAANVRHPK